MTPLAVSIAGVIQIVLGVARLALLVIVMIFVYLALRARSGG